MAISNYQRQVQAAARSFAAYDTAALAARFGLPVKEEWILLSFLHQPHRVSRKDGRAEAWEDGLWQPACFGAAMTIYDYLTNPMGRPALSGQWCSHRSFNQVRGGTLQGELGARPDNPAAPFSGRLPLLRQACQALGGTPAEGGDFSCVLPVLEGFPILLRFWDADEEFAAQLQLMWDRYTTRYLRYETTFYTAGAVYDRLHRLAGLSPSAR